MELISNFVWPENVIPIWIDKDVWDAIYGQYMRGKSIANIALQLNTHESFVQIVILRKLGRKRGQGRIRHP